MVMANRVIKYMTRMGQKTGTLNSSKKVQTVPMTVLLVTAYQNLNSGSRRMNGLNSPPLDPLLCVGNSGPSSLSKSSSGSILGVRKAMNRFRW